MKYKLYNPRLNLYAHAFLSPFDNHYYSRGPKQGIKFNREWELVKIPPYEDFQDQKGREWEWFLDYSYYDMICVRCKDDKDFDSSLSFHFGTFTEASDFVFLLSRSL